jgi:hypothetical protein
MAKKISKSKATKKTTAKKTTAKKTTNSNEDTSSLGVLLLAVAGIVLLVWFGGTSGDGPEPPPPPPPPPPPTVTICNKNYKDAQAAYDALRGEPQVTLCDEGIAFKASYVEEE